MGSIARREPAIARSRTPTIALTFNADLTRTLGTSRALSVRFPYGAPFGNPLNRWLQTRVLAEVIALLDRPATIQPSAYVWKQTQERVEW